MAIERYSDEHKKKSWSLSSRAEGKEPLELEGPGSRLERLKAAVAARAQSSGYPGAPRPAPELD